jgi:hypothetical protein
VLPTLALLLAGAAPGSTPGLPNIDFSTGRLTHWEGSGFYVTTGAISGPSRTCGVCSSDRRGTGSTALLHRTFVMPPGVGCIRFAAAAVRPSDCDAELPLSVTLESAGGRFVPLLVWTDEGWQPTEGLLPRHRGRPREYLWNVTDLIGQTVRIVLRDGDNRRGCHVWCGGFHMLLADDLNGREFARQMLKIEHDHNLALMERMDSRHFLVIGNTTSEFIRQRLRNCETIYPLFFAHFRKRGFPAREPGVRLLVSVFDSQEGLEAWLGEKVSPALGGLYHFKSNCLVVYDFAGNRFLREIRMRGAEISRRLPTDLQRTQFSEGLSMRIQGARADANIGTIMHEVAHQISFNCGMLNREGDVPLWLAEGLACYCEATVNGSWQGIGEANPSRTGVLAGPARGQGEFIPLKILLTKDDVIRSGSIETVLMGYSQSWALFRMLMEEQPQHLREYMDSIYHQRTAERRLEDFTAVFGTDLGWFEKRYHAYMKELVNRELPSHR